MNLFKRIYRGMVDRELGVLGGELEREMERLDDRTRALAALGERFERLQSRLGMRATRAARRSEQEPEEFEEQLQMHARGDESLPFPVYDMGRRR